MYLYKIVEFICNFGIKRRFSYYFSSFKSFLGIEAVVVVVNVVVVGGGSGDVVGVVNVNVNVAVNVFVVVVVGGGGGGAVGGSGVNAVHLHTTLLRFTFKLFFLNAAP